MDEITTFCMSWEAKPMLTRRRCLRNTVEQQEEDGMREWEELNESLVQEHGQLTR